MHGTGGKCLENWPHSLKAELSFSLLQSIISTQIKNHRFQSRKLKKEQDACLKLTHSHAARGKNTHGAPIKTTQILNLGL